MDSMTIDQINQHYPELPKVEAYQVHAACGYGFFSAGAVGQLFSDGTFCDYSECGMHHAGKYIRNGEDPPVSVLVDNLPNHLRFNGSDAPKLGIVPENELKRLRVIHCHECDPKYKDGCKQDNHIRFRPPNCRIKHFMDKKISDIETRRQSYHPEDRITGFPYILLRSTRALKDLCEQGIPDTNLSDIESTVYCCVYLYGGIETLINEPELWKPWSREFDQGEIPGERLRDDLKRELDWFKTKLISEICELHKFLDDKFKVEP